MKITLYGRLADAIGRELNVEDAAGISVGEMRRRLAADHPAAAATLASGRVLACIDGSLVRDEHVIGDGEQVEFLPPVSGG